MAFIELLWKARTIEKYRLRYEKEKQDCIRLINAQNPKKTLYQRLVNYNLTAKDRISKTILKRYPKGSNVYNICYYLKTDQTFPNFLLKSVIGFVGGIILTYLCFMFFVFQLSISLIHATIMSSIIGVLLTLGLAFSYRIRCLVFLLLPQFFSRVGRYTLTCYALVLILTGPATNTLKNSEVLSESLACGEEQIKTSMGHIYAMENNKPFDSKESIQILMEDVKTFGEKMKQILLRFKRLILSLAYSIQSSHNWLAASSDKCNKKLGTPYEKCINSIKDSISQCQAVLGPLFHNVCNFGKVIEVACVPLQSINFFCNVVQFNSGNFMKTVTNRLNAFTERLNSIFFVEVHVHPSNAFSGNTTRFSNQVPPGIVTEIRNKADLFLTWISWSSTVTSASLLLIIFRAKYYQHMYETRSRFDNRYITLDLRELDLKRLRQGKETILPLNKREEGKYIKTTSFRLVSSEKIHISRSAVTMAITTFKLMIHMVADYSLYWVLMTIRTHGIKQTPLRTGNIDSAFTVSGSGLLSNIYRFLLATIAGPLKATPQSPITCLPDPHPPDFQRYTQIGVLIFLLWFFALFEPYGLRLRHVIMGNYRPERARARAVWLYNHIQRTRGCFLKFARRKLHREYKYSSEEKHTLRRWLDIRIRCLWLKNLLGIYSNDLHCVLCGVIEKCRDCDRELISCKTPACPGIFCVKCFHDLGELCTICLSPVDYGDLSDVSLEKGSSNESDSDSDQKYSRSQRHLNGPSYNVITEESNEKPKYTKKSEKKKRNWLIKKKKNNEELKQAEDHDQEKKQEQLIMCQRGQVPKSDNNNNINKKILTIKQKHYMRKADVARHRKLVKIDLEKKLIKDDFSSDVFCTMCSKYCKIYQFTGNINNNINNFESVKNVRHIIKNTFDSSERCIASRITSKSNKSPDSSISGETVQKLLQHFQKLRKYSVNRKLLDRTMSNLSCSFTSISSSLWKRRFCANMRELKARKCELRPKKIKQIENKMPRVAVNKGKPKKSNFTPRRTLKHSRRRRMPYIETNTIKIQSSLLIHNIFQRRVIKTRKASRPKKIAVNKMMQGDYSQTVDNLLANKAIMGLSPRKCKQNNNDRLFQERNVEYSSYFLNADHTNNRPRKRLFKKCSSYILNKVCSSLHGQFSCIKRDDVTDENSRTNHKRRKKLSHTTRTDEKATARAYRISTFLSELDWVKRCRKSDSNALNELRNNVGAEFIEDFINADEGNKVLLQSHFNLDVPKSPEKMNRSANKNKRKTAVVAPKKVGLSQTIDFSSSASAETYISGVNYEDKMDLSNLDPEEEKLIDNRDYERELEGNKDLAKKAPGCTNMITERTKDKKNDKLKYENEEMSNYLINAKGEPNKKITVNRKSASTKINPKDIEETTVQNVKSKKCFWKRLFSKEKRAKKTPPKISKADAEVTVKPIILNRGCQASKSLHCGNKATQPATDIGTGIEKAVVATQVVEKKRYRRNVCTFYKCKGKSLTSPKKILKPLPPEILETEIATVNYSDISKGDHNKLEDKVGQTELFKRISNVEETSQKEMGSRSTQTFHKGLKSTEVQCNDFLKFNSSTPKEDRTAAQGRGDIIKKRLSLISNKKGKLMLNPSFTKQEPKNHVKFVTASVSSLTRCPSVSPILFSDESMKSDDTSVYSVMHVSYDGHKKLKEHKNLITKSNQGTNTDAKTLCDVSTATTDWWSPISERKNIKVKPPKRTERRDARRNVGIYTKIMDTRDVSTACKVVTFKSHAQLIPSRPRGGPDSSDRTSSSGRTGYSDKRRKPGQFITVGQPGSSNILSPSRYLLESQRYYNELFSNRPHLPRCLANTEDPCDRKLLLPLHRHHSSHNRRGSRTKRREEVQTTRRRMKNVGVLENVWTASESSQKSYGIDKTDSSLASLHLRKRNRYGRKHISTQVSRHRQLRPIDEKHDSLKVKVRKGKLNLCSTVEDM